VLGRRESPNSVVLQNDSLDSEEDDNNLPDLVSSEDDSEEDSNEDEGALSVARSILTSLAPVVDDSEADPDWNQADEDAELARQARFIRKDSEHFPRCER
jgi:hypothetical protein